MGDSNSSWGRLCVAAILLFAFWYVRGVAQAYMSEGFASLLAIAVVAGAYYLFRNKRNNVSKDESG